MASHHFRYLIVFKGPRGGRGRRPHGDNNQRGAPRRDGRAPPRRDDFPRDGVRKVCTV